MGLEKQGKGGGGYVGGFLHLFDWNAKSRKKLFSNNSDVPEQSKQKKRNDGNFPMTRLHLMDQEDSVAGSSFKGSSDYSCASSVTEEEIGVSKAPGVVAKLMGLDSLPTSNFSDGYSTPFFGSQSLRDAHYYKKNPEFHQDNQIMFSGSLPNKPEEPIRNKTEPEPKPQKVVSRPIERFQTETLPPKSAKSIPVTQHKLMSPIKSTGFVPSKDAIHIMEAAAKIIESGNQVSSKAKMPHVGSSVPLKVRDLKEKVEAAKKPSKPAETSRKPAEPVSAKHIKGQSLIRSWNETFDTKPFSVSPDIEESSSVGLKNKGKSISLAVQAKVNVQKREGLTQNGCRSSFGQKDQNEFMSSQPFKSQPSTQRSSQKKPSSTNAPSVLRQNNQKQNCLAERGKAPAKSLLSTNAKGRKVMPADSSLGRQRSSSKSSGNTKVGSRKMGFDVTDDGKEVAYSGTTSVTRKKRCIDGDFNFRKDQNVSNIDKNVKGFQSNGLMDKQYTWDEDSKRSGMDVVSFTFTAPMTRSVPSPETFRETKDKSNDAFFAEFQGENVVFSSGGSSSSRLSSVGRNVIGGDALSSLLEQKLRELTLGVESSHNKARAAGSSASKFQDFSADLEAFRAPSELHAKESKKGSYTDNLDYRWGSVFSSTNYDGLLRKDKLQGVEEIYDCGSSNDSELRNLLDCRQPSPISILEPSVFAESCNSSDTADSNSTEGNKHCSSVQAQDNFDMRPSKKFHPMEVDTDLSDSASSSSSTRITASKTLTLTATDIQGQTKWELEYVRKIMCNTETMFYDLAYGRAHEILDPRLFDQLKSHENEPKLQRKVLFDCVGESLDFRCGQYVKGGYRAWEKGLSMVRRKKWLAEEVYKEILGWEAMVDCMVDELVDKDMSSQCGKWLDFEAEAFEMGVEIEGRILNSLINEAIADILVL